ncbi:MAG: diaminopimelate decarboxylase, partial [Acidimicrobiia bacterium]|nr:diaminopimelate decarboxylase [Acidimicrobiia bacterium]
MAWDNVLPATWTWDADRAVIGGVALDEIADAVGTPCYVVDEAHLAGRLSRFRAAFGPDVGLVYAAKAFWCLAMAETLAPAGWMADVVSEGELAIALAGGLSPSRILVHGNVKTDREIELAIAAGVARIVVDAPDEMRRVVAIADGRRVELMLRLNIDVGADTHPKIRTTGAAAQFGMTTRQADEALGVVGPGVSVRGVHVHIGSQLRDPRLHAEALTEVGRFVEERRERFGDTGSFDLDIGGGFPVAYLHTDVIEPLEAFADAILSAASGFPEARILVEPGRSVVATAGVS